MNEDFGKKLEEARTRQGISIRQAADATKIRSDFLLSFENDKGNFKMPEIYKRGFLKLYARYLKLDVDEITSDYLASKKSAETKKILKAQKDEREILGRMELNASDPHTPTAQTTLPLANTDPIKAHSQSEEFQKPKLKPKKPKKPREPLLLPETKALYMKIGLIFGGTLALFAVFAVVISSIFSDTDTEMNPNLATTTPEIAIESDTIFNNSLKTKAEALEETLTLRGDGDVHVVIRQENDKKRLFSGNVTKNKPVTITRKGPVKIRFSNGSKLTIQKPDGKRVRPGREGVGWIEI